MSKLKPKIDPPGAEFNGVPPLWWSTNIKRLTEVGQSFIVPEEYAHVRKSAYAFAQYHRMRVSVRRDKSGALRCLRTA